MKKLTLLLCLGIFVICSTAYAQSKADQIDVLVSMFHNYNQFTGSVLVAENGKVIYKKGFGMANRSTNTPNRPDTRHRLASVTKQFTSMAIMQLVADGKLNLEVPITTYLPSYPAVTGNKITIHHLLTHTSGIPNYTSFENYFDIMGKSLTPSEIIQLFADSSLEFTPGERFAYSNSGYVLLGHIIETVTGKTYAEFVHDKIFSPLNMINSGYEQADELPMNKAIGYDQAGAVFSASRFIDMSIPFAAGALFSSVEDMHLWNEALYMEKILPKKYLDMIFAPSLPVNNQHYAYGWEIGTLPVGNSGETVKTIGHSGGINGFVTQNIRIPAERSSIILLSNSSGSLLREMLIAINGILHDTSYDLPKKSAAFEVMDVISTKGIDQAVALFDTVRNSGNYYLHENEMNTIGYQLMQTGKLKEAATVFKWNVDEFPRSFNVYDSYGEILLALGDTAQSIVNYKKSLEINPNNEYGFKALRSMGLDPDLFIRKVPIEELQLLEGDYVNKNEANGREWKISFSVENGILTGKDGGYQYKLAPQGNNEFINPDDGAVLKFDSRDQNSITLLLFNLVFRKV